MTSHRGILTKYKNLAQIMITKLGATPLQQAAQELERLKQQINWKVKDIKAGYDILLSCLATDDPEDVRLNTVVEETIARHATISRKMVQALGAAEATQQGPADAPARAGRDLMKLKEDLKPTVLTLDFNPQEFQAW